MICDLVVMNTDRNSLVAPAPFGYGQCGLRCCAAVTYLPQEATPPVRPSRPYPLTVLLADPDGVVRAGLRALLTDDPRFTVVGEAGADLADVVGLAIELAPGLVVLDRAVGDGLDLRQVMDLRRVTPGCSICLHTHAFVPQDFLDALLAGAHGYLLKRDADCAYLLDAFALVGRCGASVIDPTIASPFRDRSAGGLFLNPFQQLPDLSDRERTLLALLVAGATRPEAATQTGVSERTVHRTVAEVARKLGVSTDLALGFRAASFGLNA
jgi:DNA-binding NarL/FixJ family response regulator